MLLDSLEALQAESPGEQAQRIVTLTAPLTASHMKEGMLEQR